uniref:Uncharacterized protein n=1 Tax=Romanomermis culicivorax TaxID=13658 RepID=A0A915IR92_ROMCU
MYLRPDNKKKHGENESQFFKWIIFILLLGTARCNGKEKYKLKHDHYGYNNNSMIRKKNLLRTGTHT